MAATVSRALPPARVLVVGERAHGPSDVIEALAALTSGRRPGPSDRRPPVVNDREGWVGIINDFGPRRGAPLMRAVSSAQRAYTLWCCVDGAESVLLTLCRAVDAVLWVLSAKEPLNDTPALELLDAARTLDARVATVFVTDASEIHRESLDALELRAREMLDAAGFDPNESLVLFERGPLGDGEDWKRSAAELRDALDRTTPLVKPERDDLWFTVERVRDWPNRYVLQGIVERGALSVGDRVELVTVDARRDVQVTGIEDFRRDVNSIVRGQRAGVRIAGVGRVDVTGESVLAKPSTARVVTRLRGTAFPLPQRDERTRRTRWPERVTVSGFDMATTARIEWAGETELTSRPCPLELVFDRPRIWPPSLVATLVEMRERVATVLAIFRADDEAEDSPQAPRRPSYVDEP